MLGNIVRNALGRLRPVTTVDQVRDLIDKGQLDAALAQLEHLDARTPRRDLVQRALQAEIAFRQGRDDEAEASFKWVLTQEPGHAHAHYGLSLQLYERGDAEAALRHAQFASNVQKQDPRYFAQVGLCHVKLGNFPLAEGLLRSALRALPGDKSCWNNMGIVQAAKGDRAYARECFNRALALDPGFRHAQANLELLGIEESEQPRRGFVGPSASDLPDDADRLPAEATDGGDEPWRLQWHEVLALRKAERFDEALRAADTLIVNWPDVPEVTCWVSKLYSTQGDPQGGLDTLRAYLSRHPDDVKVLLALGKAYSAQSEHQLAEDAVRHARTLGEEDSDLLLQLSEIIHKRERYGEAAQVAQEAMDASPTVRPRILGQLAAARVMACQYDKAMEAYEQLFAMRGKDNSPALGGYAMCLNYMGRFDEAAEVLDRLIQFNPHEPGLRLQRGQMRLLRQDFAGGWDDYAYRGLSQTRSFRVLPFPRWQGEPLEGKRIVVIAEQGLGDQIMLSSCLPDLLALGPAHVYVEAIVRVAATLARSFPQCTVIPSGQNINLDWARSVGDADFYVPLGDLPGRFRRSVADFPGKAYLVADPARVAHWRSQIQAQGPGPYIGISWRGGTELTRTVLRSMSPEQLAPFTRGLPATWVNLQYGEVAEDLGCARSVGFEIHHWPEAIKDLDEFAALIAALDAVITVCNTTVHYAGGVGRKTWVLAPCIPEWRYGLDNRKMPWYPDVTVLRQPSPGEWEPPIMEAIAEATTYLSRSASE